MTTVLVATASYTTAAACDYLGPQLGAGDEVVVLAVEESGMDARDAGDATNVARSGSSSQWSPSRSRRETRQRRFSPWQ